MGDTISINDTPALAQAATTQGAYQSDVNSALAGYQLGQTGAVRSALQNMVPDDPSSVKTAYGQLQQAGAFPVANDLFKSSVLSPYLGKGTIASQLAALHSGDTQQSSDQTPAPATPASSTSPVASAAAGYQDAPLSNLNQGLTGPAPTPGNFAFDRQHAYETMAQSAQDVNALLNAPEEDRPQLAAEIKQKYLARGVPEPAIDAALDNLTTPALQSLKDHYTQVASTMANFEGVTPRPASGSAVDSQGNVTVTPPKPMTPPGAATVPEGDNGATAALTSPPAVGGGAEGDAASQAVAKLSDPQQQAALRKVGVSPAQVAMHPTDYTWTKDLLEHPDMIEQLGVLRSEGLDLTPLLQTAQSVQAPRIAQAAANEFSPARLRAEQEATVDLRPPAPGAVPLYDGAGQVQAWRLQDGTTQAISRTAEAQSGGSSAGTAPYDVVQVTNPKGAPVFMTREAAAREGAENGGVVAVGPTTGQAVVNQGRPSQALDLLKLDPVARQQAVDDASAAQRGLSFLESNQLNQTTPVKAKISEMLRSIGIQPAENFSGDLASYEALAKQQLISGAHDAFPSRITDRDLALYDKVTPGLTTPGDAAKMAFGLKYAKANRALGYENFKANYNGDADPGKITNAWASGEGGRSLLADPIWRNITIGGKPALITVQPTPQNKLKAPVMIFGAGTGHPIQVQ